MLRGLHEALSPHLIVSSCAAPLAAAARIAAGLAKGLASWTQGPQKPADATQTSGRAAARLWAHEACRVLEDCLGGADERATLGKARALPRSPLACRV